MAEAMSTYARNHLQDDWAAIAREEMALRVEAAEKEASWYFDRATRREKAEFDAAIKPLSGATGPQRDRARSRWHETTREARTLLEATIDCLLATGEVSAELDDKWTELINRDAERKDE